MPSSRVARPVFLLAAVVLLAVPAPAVAEPPAKIFAKSCSPCHGKSGQPSAVFAKQGVRDFTLASWHKATTDAQIEKSIREGKKGTMMAGFAGQFSADEIKGLVRYIRSLEKK